MQGNLKKKSRIIWQCVFAVCLCDSRHDARQVEHLSRQVGHVTVDEDKERLDDTCVWGEAWSEGSEDAVDGANHDATERDH